MRTYIFIVSKFQVCLTDHGSRMHTSRFESTRTVNTGRLNRALIERTTHIAQSRYRMKYFSSCCTRLPLALPCWARDSSLANQRGVTPGVRTADRAQWSQLVHNEACTNSAVYCIVCAGLGTTLLSVCTALHHTVYNMWSNLSQCIQSSYAITAYRTLLFEASRRVIKSNPKWSPQP